MRWTYNFERVERYSDQYPIPAQRVTTVGCHSDAPPMHVATIIEPDSPNPCMLIETPLGMLALREILDLFSYHEPADPFAAAGIDIKDVLDLSKWEQDEGYGSIHGPICPHCGKDFGQGCCGANGIAICPHCFQRCRWQLIPSPLGPAWTTWRKLPAMQ